jgi:hypothetical protein
MAKTSEVRIEGLNELLRALNKLPKEAKDELRDASQRIADNLMVPAWQEAARQAGPWGDRISESVRVKRDRIPAVQMGYQRKAFSGGASTNTVRYPSSEGPTGTAPQALSAFGSPTHWLAQSGSYKQQALDEWGNAVERIVADFNNGRF